MKIGKNQSVKLRLRLIFFFHFLLFFVSDGKFVCQCIVLGLPITSGICAVGSFIYSSPLAMAAEQRTKVEILFKSSIVKVKLGQKAEQRYRS